MDLDPLSVEPGFRTLKCLTWKGNPKPGILDSKAKKSPGSERNPDVLACFIGMYTLANGTRLSPLDVKTKVYCENMKPFKQKLLE